MAEETTTLWQQMMSWAGLVVEKATLVTIWLLTFGLANRILAGGRKHDRGRSDVAATC